MYSYTKYYDYYYESDLECVECEYNYYLYSYKYDITHKFSECINNQKKIKHCKSYHYDEFYDDVMCSSCESDYYLMDGKCYKIPSKIKNCNIHEEFYTNEVSCLKPIEPIQPIQPIDDEEWEIEKEEEKEEEKENLLNFDKYLFLKYLYLEILYLLL